MSCNQLPLNLGSKRLENGYIISPAGKVTRRGNVLTCSKRSDGYISVKLYKGNGTYTTQWIHRLVLESFVGPCPPGMECRHLNGNPSDNRLINLAWGTKEENAHDKVLHGTVNAPVNNRSRSALKSPAGAPLGAP